MTPEVLTLGLTGKSDLPAEIFLRNVEIDVKKLQKRPIQWAFSVTPDYRLLK